MRIIIAAGGTGGHIIPAIAVANALKQEDASLEISFVGIGKPIEDKLVTAAGFELETVRFLPVLGAGPMGLLRLAVEFPKAVLASISLFRRLKPSLLIGFGGFPSFVPFVVSFFFGIPRILHEQNVKVGLANKILSVFANKIIAVTGANGFLKSRGVLFLPNPVRDSFLNIPTLALPERDKPLTVLVVGGSQGAVAVNTAVLGLVDFFDRHGIKVIHQTGKSDFERVKNLYEERNFSNVELSPFIDSIVQSYESAHLVICRAGAMTVAEVSAAGRPAIFIPLPISGGHQAENVHALCEAGGAICLKQDDGLIVVLRQTMQQLISKQDQLEKMATIAREFSMVDGEPSAKTIAKSAIKMIN